MTREEAIETLKANYPDACFEQLRDAVDAAISALRQPEPQWIPVTKKAHPDLPIRVQVQISNGWIITAYWEDGNWHSVPDWYGNGTPIEEDDYIKIEAWRELPDLYTGGREE